MDSSGLNGRGSVSLPMLSAGLAVDCGGVVSVANMSRWVFIKSLTTKVEFESFPSNEVATISEALVEIDEVDDLRPPLR